MTPTHPKEGAEGGRSLGYFKRALRNLRVAIICGLVVDGGGQQTDDADAAPR
jgi:hypothetical protein